MRKIGLQGIRSSIAGWSAAYGRPPSDCVTPPPSSQTAAIEPLRCPFGLFVHRLDDGSEILDEVMRVQDPSLPRSSAGGACHDVLGSQLATRLNALSAVTNRAGRTRLRSGESARPASPRWPGGHAGWAAGIGEGGVRHPSGAAFVSVVGLEDEHFGAGVIPRSSATVGPL